MDIKKAKMTWMAQRNSSGDPPISNVIARLQWEADWMSYSDTYYSHKEGKNDMDESNVCIAGSLDATPNIRSWINHIRSWINQVSSL